MDYSPRREGDTVVLYGESGNGVLTLDFARRARNNEITLGASFIKFTSGVETAVRAGKYEILFSAGLSLPITGDASLINMPNYPRPVNFRKCSSYLRPVLNPKREKILNFTRGRLYRENLVKFAPAIRFDNPCFQVSGQVYGSWTGLDENKWERGKRRI